jgi:hypothetical protein
MVDCERSLKLQFTVKAALRRGSAAVALGLWQEALASFRAVLAHEPHNRQAAEQVSLCEAMQAEADYTGQEGEVDESSLL